MMRTRFAVVLAAVTIGACGGGSGDLSGESADASDASRVIEIRTTDQLRFDPDDISVSAGETVELRITNDAQARHEFVLGPVHEHDMEMKHMGSDAEATGAIEPGDTASVAWTFTEAGEVTFACYIDGHNQAGMTGTITVTS